MDVKFLAYAPDCIVSGTVDLHEPRFADMLVDRDVLAIRDVALDCLEDGHRTRVPVADLAWDELLFAVASGPRGAAALRPRRLRTVPVRVLVSGYEVVGSLHAPLHRNPLSDARERRIVALTDAAVRVPQAGGNAVHRHDTILLNGALRELLEPVSASTVEATRGDGRLHRVGLPLRPLPTG